MARKAVSLPSTVFNALQRQAAKVKRSADKARLDLDKLQEMIIDAHVEGGWPLQAIGEAVGVSRARVHQLVSERVDK